MWNKQGKWLYGNEGQGNNKEDCVSVDFRWEEMVDTFTLVWYGNNIVWGSLVWYSDSSNSAYKWGKLDSLRTDWHSKYC